MVDVVDGPPDGGNPTVSRNNNKERIMKKEPTEKIKLLIPRIKIMGRDSPPYNPYFDFPYDQDLPGHPFRPYDLYPPYARPIPHHVYPYPKPYPEPFPKPYPKPYPEPYPKPYPKPDTNPYPIYGPIP